MYACRGLGLRGANPGVEVWASNMGDGRHP